MVNMIIQEFKEDINELVQLSKMIGSEIGVRKKYYFLVKKYHPDMHDNNTKQYDECMMLLNHVYANIKMKENEYMENIKQKSSMVSEDKFTFINRLNKKVIVSDKSLFLYRKGMDRIM
jgi:hypothetical protein